VNAETLRRFAHSWIAAWNRHELEHILTHYAGEVEFSSPFVTTLAADADGRLSGKAALRDYVARTLRAFPGLEFELLNVFEGIHGGTLVYRSVNDLLAAETMEFNEAGLVRSVTVSYSMPDIPAQDVRPVASIEWRREDYLLTDDARRTDLDAICALLQTTYWADDRSREVIEKSLRHSTCLHLLHEGKQVGLIRGVTDHATFTWVCDVIVHPEHRGRGLGKWLMKCFLEHPELQTISHHLCTKDAHSLYEAFGFQRIEAMRRSDRPMAFLLKNPPA
jgi:N-acetylglutamate synthase-like GNAT family acetyltransferase